MNGKGTFKSKGKGKKKVGAKGKRATKYKPKPTTANLATGMPERVFGIVKWSGTNATSTGGLGLPKQYVLNMNSLYDPDNFSNMTNDQPTYFDVLSPLYSHYFINKCSGHVKIKCGDNCRVLVFPSNELINVNASSLTYDEMVCYPYCQSRIVSAFNDIVELKFNYYLPKITGQPNMKQNDDYTGYCSPAPSNPVNLVFLNIVIYPIYGDDVSFVMDLTTYQYYEMWERTTQPRS